jgi:hypothetical protein
MLTRKICFALVFVVAFIPNILSAEQILTAVKIDGSPIIDGAGDDSFWDQAQALITRDKVADIDLSIKCVYSSTDIYFLVSYPDPDESRSHKPWIWNKNKEIYVMGPHREDTFVLKWATVNETSDLSVQADVPYAADLWFWKACRTDPAGYADDKIQIIGTGWTKKSNKIITKSGKTMYLQRLADKGKPAYRSQIKLDYQGDDIPQYAKQTPSGSRADIRAKGVWRNGNWTIEFARSLNTGQPDDVQFDSTKKYFFGASRFEIAGRKPNPKLTQPLYGSGDVSEALYLVFAK